MTLKTKRECGSCTMCCKTMGVIDMDPPKPIHTWCAHCDKGKGCRIYEDRPPSCRGFDCIWLQDEFGVMGPELRPDKTGVVLQPLINGAVVAHCDPSRPTAWRHPKLLPILKRLAAAGFPVSVEAGSRYWIITQKTEWEVPDYCKESQPNGMVYIRCPSEVKREIELYVRPECRDLRPIKVNLDGMLEYEGK